MSIAVVVGNPKLESRTLQFANAVADAVAHATGDARGLTLDLATVGSSLFEWPNGRLNDLVEEVRASTILVVASPTYKAAYTGLLKGFFDRFPTDGLENVVAVPLMTGAVPTHALAVDVSLRPLLVELGASVPTTSIFLVITDLDQLTNIVSAWIERNASALDRVTPISAPRIELPG
jgi:FMN reductase